MPSRLLSSLQTQPLVTLRYVIADVVYVVAGVSFTVKLRLASQNMVTQVVECTRNRSWLPDCGN